MLVLGNYIMHYQSINQSVIMGHSIPMPFSHIRYTLMLCFSFFCLIYMHRQGWFIYSENEKHLQVFFAVILFVSIHILSVRSGLVALYAGLLCLLFYIVLFEKKYVAATLLLLVFTLVPFITYRFVPSFQNKMNYMRYDLSGLATGEINNRYDVMRLASMKTGLLVWKQNKIIGTGAGDLGSAMNSIYETTLPQLLVTNRLLPHNQLVWVLASLGVVGFSAFMFAFMFPLLINRYYRNWLFVVFHVTIFSSFFTEATLEEQIGTGFYLLFLLVLLNQLKNE